MELLQLARTRAEIGDGKLFKDVDHGIAHFLHHAPNRAPRFVGAGTFLVKALAHTTDRREGAFEAPGVRPAQVDAQDRLVDTAEEDTK